MLINIPRQSQTVPGGADSNVKPKSGIRPTYIAFLAFQVCLCYINISFGILSTSLSRRSFFPHRYRNHHV